MRFHGWTFEAVEKLTLKSDLEKINKYGAKKKEYNVSGLCVVALSRNLKLTTTHSWAITQNPCYVPFLFGR